MRWLGGGGPGEWSPGANDKSVVGGGWGGVGGHRTWGLPKIGATWGRERSGGWVGGWVVVMVVVVVVVRTMVARQSCPSMKRQMHAA